MKKTHPFTRIALAVGLVGLAACSGSDSSTNRQKNSALPTNVYHVEGSMAVTNQIVGNLLPTTNQYTMSMDADLSAKGSGDNTNYNMRSAFSNFTLKSVSVADMSKDFTKISWATCPVDAHLGTNSDATDSTQVDFLFLQFQETTDQLGCNVPISPKKTSLQITIRRADGQKMSDVADNASLSLAELKLDHLADASTYSVTGKIVAPKDSGSPYSADIVFSSTKINDYQPSDLKATSSDAGISVTWARSADLTAEDQVGYNIEWSTDEFKTVSGNFAINENVESANIESCLITRSILLNTDPIISVRVTPKIADSDKSAPVIATVTRNAGDFQCPVDKPAAPSNVRAKVSADGNSVEVSWDDVVIEGADLSYCVYQEIEDEANAPMMANIACGMSPITLSHGVGFAFSGQGIFKAVTFNNTAHSVSDYSEPATVDFPSTPSITNISSSLTDDGSLLFRWKPLASSFSDEFAEIELFETILFFSVNQDIPCRADLSPAEFLAGMTTFMKSNAVDQRWILDHIRITRSIDGGQILSPEALGSEFKPGSTVNICMLRMGPWGLSNLSSGTFTYPAAAGSEVTTTVAPVVDETAKAAIITSDVSEVQLPAGDVNVEINVADVYAGFGVTASDVKSVEYQIADGSWVALTGGKSLKIPKSASKLAIRVTKNSGEKVVSQKKIVHTAASTNTTVAVSDTTIAPSDTTLAPADTTAVSADTTAPVTTEAPASSDSSSSNNTVLYILGFAFVAGAVVMLLKKKSASTK